jgi:DNA polymerase/3'-5' exonuclease PolX
MNTNQEIIKIFGEIIHLLEIKGDPALNYKMRAYKKAIFILENLKVDIASVYEEKKLKGITELGIGEKNAKKIEEYIKKGKIKDFEELKEETAIRQVITHYFETKGVGLQELKNNAKKRKIIYSRFTKPAKQLLELSGSIPKAFEAIDKVASWAKSRKLDYAIETVFKKWLELDDLKPKEIVKKPFYKGQPMIYSEMKKKWFVISKYGEWLEFADKKETIEWKIIE